MHLFGAEIEVDSTRSAQSLIFELVAKTGSSPGWLSVSCSVPTLQGSGLIAILPAFRAQQPPTYTIEGRTIASSRIIRDVGYSLEYDIIFKATSDSGGHDVCSKVLDIVDIGEPYIYCNGDDERLSSSDYMRYEWFAFKLVSANLAPSWQFVKNSPRSAFIAHTSSCLLKQIGMYTRFYAEGLEANYLNCNREKAQANTRN
jgi:hypothetical protein